MIRIAILVATIALLAWPARVWLVRARWTAIAPRAAVLLWQAMTLSLGLSAIAACVEVASRLSAEPGTRKRLSDTTNTFATVSLKVVSPNYVFGLTVGLIVMALVSGVLLTRAIGIRRARRYQREVLDLVAQESADATGALVLEHPSLAAYSVPGRNPRVVLSSGAVGALSPEELASVLAHERAHASFHHDRTRFVFEAFATVLPRSRSLSTVSGSVATLLEMAADDQALRECDPSTFASALYRMADDQDRVGNQPGSAVRCRAERVLTPRPRSRRITIAACASSVCLLALPVAELFVTPVWR